MKVIIDRIEGDFAVCVIGKKAVSIPVQVFENAAEGNVYNISYDSGETEKRLKENNKKLKSLFNGGK